MKRVAVVGAGYFAAFHHEAWARMPDVALVAIADPDIDRAGAAVAAHGGGARYGDALEMALAERPDIIDIAAPPETHRMLIETLSPHCRALICQKPFCGTLAEARAALAAARTAGARVIVHENFRHQPWYREVKRLLDAGALGALHQASFRLRPGDGQGPRAYLDRQPYFRRMERFLVHETAIHWIDTFRYLFGEPSAVFADLRRMNPAIAGEDAGLVLFRHEGGMRAMIDADRHLDHAATNLRRTMGELLVEGVRATLRLDGEGRLFLRAHGEMAERECAYGWEDRGFGGDCVRLTCRAALEAFRSGAPAETEAPAYLRNMEIEEAVYASAEAGDWMAV